MLLAPSHNLIRPNHSLWRDGYGRQKPPPGARINYSHTLARGLRGVWVWSNGSVNSLTGNVPGTNYGSTAAPGQFGLGRKFVTASKQYITLGTPTALNLPGALTIVASLEYAPTADNQVVLASAKVDVAAVQYGGVILSTRHIAFVQNALTYGATGAQIVTANVAHQMVWGRFGATNNWTCFVYLDGLLDKLATTAQNPQTQQQTAIGRYGAYVPNLHLNATLDYLYVYDRVLSAAEIAQLYNQPFAFFQ